MIHWSVSQSSAWGCPRAWWLRHIAQAAPAQPDAPNRVRGRAIHAALEHAYRLAVARPTEGFMVQFSEEALRVLYETWGHEQRLTDFHTVASQLADVLLTLPAPRPSSVLGIEHKAKYTRVDEYGSYEINCVLDLVLRTGTTSAHIRDWKSGQIEDDLTRNVQLALYDMVARTAWPWLTHVTVGLYSVRENREVVAELTAEDRGACLEALLHDATEAHLALMEVRGGVKSAASAFPPAPDAERCTGCAFRSYCPVYAGAILPLRPGVSIQDVHAERQRLAHRLESVTP